MRIVLFPSSYAPVIGGLQTVAQNLALRFKQYGHEVRVVTNRYPVSLPGSDSVDNVPVERLLLLKPQFDQLRRERPDLFLASFYFYPATHRRLRSLFGRLRPEIVNVHFPDAQIPFVLALRRHFKFRLVVSLHGSEVERWSTPDLKTKGSNNGSSRGGKQLLKTILREADAVTACSKDLMSKASKLEPSVSAKSYVVPNGVDLELYKNTTRHAHPRPYVLSYGRLTHSKGFDLLLSAFAEVSREISNVDLIIAGEGQESASLKELAQNAGIGDRVHFVGRANAKQIIELLNGCLFLVVPSRSESFGISALEGMAAGKAVLATKVGGLPEFLDTSANKLVNPSVEELAAGIRGWLSSQDLVSARGSHNRLTAAEYGWDRTAEGYLDAYGLVRQEARIG